MVLVIQKAKTEGDHLRPEFRDELEPPNMTPLIKKKNPSMDGSTQEAEAEGWLQVQDQSILQKKSVKKQNQKQKQTNNNNKTDVRDRRKGIRRREMERGNS